MGWVTLRDRECEIEGRRRTTVRCYRMANRQRATNAGCTELLSRCEIQGETGKGYCCPADPGSAQPSSADEPAGGATETSDKTPATGWEEIFSIPQSAAQVAKQTASSIVGGGEPGAAASGFTRALPYLVLGGVALGTVGTVWYLLRRSSRHEREALEAAPIPEVIV